MIVKKIEEILNHFEKKQFSPVYLLTGEENYYIDLLASKFEEEILDESEKDFKDRFSVPLLGTVPEFENKQMKGGRNAKRK